MFALPKPKHVATPTEEDRNATRQRVLDLTVREGPVRDHRWHLTVLEMPEKHVRTTDGSLVTLEAACLGVWVHVDDFAHWGERKGGRG